MVEKKEHQNDIILKYLKQIDGLLFYKDRKKELRVVSKDDIDEFLEEIYSKLRRTVSGLINLLK